MNDKSTSLWSMVLIPAAITLLVSIVRLIGELQGWSPSVFGDHSPGADPAARGWLGITILVPIFGFWFGRQLRRQTGGPPHAGRSALRYAVGVAVIAGGLALLVVTGLVTMGTKEAPAEASGLGYALAVDLIGLPILLWAWPRLGGALLLYAFLARLPVIAITYLAITNEWATHHVLMPPGVLLPEGTSLFAFLATPQLTIWPLFTLGIGGLFGCLGATLTRRGGE